MGCGSSLSILPSKNKNKVVDSVATSDTSIPKSGRLPSIVSADKREENLEPFTLVCLEKRFDENDQELRSIIDYICFFNDVDRCGEFLKDSTRRNGIFLIVSSEHCTGLISHIHEVAAIIAIYVFQAQKGKHIDKQWAKRYAKVMSEFIHEECSARSH
jgi:hypothetical protein